MHNLFWVVVMALIHKPSTKSTDELPVSAAKAKAAKKNIVVLDKNARGCIEVCPLLCLYFINIIMNINQKNPTIVNLNSCIDTAWKVLLASIMPACNYQQRKQNLKRMLDNPDKFAVDS